MAGAYSFADFKARAEKGLVWEQKLAQLLRENGLDVDNPVLELRDESDVSAISDFTRNQEDLVANGKVIECKSRSLSFKSPDTFPYPDIIVDTKSGWERKANKPSFYVFWSDKTGELVAIDGATRSKWKERRMTDRARRMPDTFLIAPKSLLKSKEWLLQALK